MKEAVAMPIRLAKRSLLRVFMLGVSAPTFLVMPASPLRALGRGETVGRAWGRVGHHMTRSLGGLTGERRTDGQAR